MRITTMLLIPLLTCPVACGRDNPDGQSTRTFTNPIVNDGADPWVIYWQDAYYYCYSKRNAIHITKSSNIQYIGSDESVRVWIPPAGTRYSNELWAPELHYLENKWYIYVAADDGNNHNHRMYVLEGTSQNPQDPFTLKGKIADSTDRWAIDGTVLEVDNGDLFFIWSGWEGTVNIRQDIYIAPMSNPWTISGSRVKISAPEYAWERIGNPYVNEGPEVLKHDGHLFIIYSASGSWTDDYCLGQLSCNGGDVLQADSWVKKNVPLFSKTGTVFGPGHASFVRSPDGSEDWIVYHAAKYQGAGWNRDVRAQKFHWNPDGSPNFGIPVQTGVELPVPSRGP